MTKEMKYSFDRPLTPRVRNVLTMASQDAQRRGHDYIGVEHILMAILVEGESVAAQAISAVIPLSKVKDSLDSMINAYQKSASRAGTSDPDAEGT
jgi:ATP-dependent Clp protease ATP-binding subunit ClpC